LIHYRLRDRAILNLSFFEVPNPKDSFVRLMNI